MVHQFWQRIVFSEWGMAKEARKWDREEIPYISNYYPTT